MEHPEKEWIARYRGGDVEALGRLVEHYRRPLFGFILRMTEGRGDAEEIFQEVWVRALRNLHTYRHKSFLSWLFRIAHNLVIDQARKKKPAMSLQDENEEGQRFEEKVASPSLGPALESGGRELGGKIGRAVSMLPPEQREVFMMRMEGGVPFREIAKIQGTSINTALARMQYALAKLRETLKTEHDELAASLSQ
ncbi:MAG: sigma-70 family RNA polymerase sigma factor [Verrucomicrobia bacterium]|nr:sigma-70 family RNA polymerase sigma factor [Verrucomicrobiota bacterium]